MPKFVYETDPCWKIKNLGKVESAKTLGKFINESLCSPMIVSQIEGFLILPLVLDPLGPILKA